MGGVRSITVVVVVLFIMALSSGVKSCPPSDRTALHEPYLGIFNSWTGADCCHKWYGVSCDQETRRVADINLRGESEEPIFERAHRTGYMTGYISPAICKLARLSSITIADWRGISGEIPRCITTLPFLRIKQRHDHVVLFFVLIAIISSHQTIVLIAIISSAGRLKVLLLMLILYSQSSV